MGRKKDPNQKENILKTAFQLFIREGYKSVTINKITTATGLSKGAIYHYFQSKEEIYEATLTKYYFEMVEFDISTVATGIFRDDIKLLYTHIAQLFKRIEELTDDGLDFPIRNFFSFQLESETIPKVRDQVTKTVHQYRNEMTKMVRQAQDSGQIRNDLDSEVIALQIIGIIEGTAIHNSTVKKNINHFLLKQYEKLFNSYLPLLEPQHS